MQLYHLWLQPYSNNLPDPVSHGLTIRGWSILRRIWISPEAPSCRPADSTAPKCFDSICDQVLCSWSIKWLSKISCSRTCLVWLFDAFWVMSMSLANGWECQQSNLGGLLHSNQLTVLQLSSPDLLFSGANVIYTLFLLKSGPKHWLSSQNPWTNRYNFLFSFLSVFPLPEAYQNDPKFHLNTLLSSNTQKSSKHLANTTWFWVRYETFQEAPPATKADTV